MTLTYCQLICLVLHISVTEGILQSGPPVELLFYTLHHAHTYAKANQQLLLLYKNLTFEHFLLYIVQNGIQEKISAVSADILS